MPAADTVTVACKLPAGLVIDIRHPPKIVKDEVVSGGVIKAVRLNGSAPQRRMDSDGQTLGEHQMVAGGYGLTPNVDKEFFDKWLAENRDYAPVAAGLIKAFPNINAARNGGRERSEVVSGLEPVTQKDMKKAGIEPRNDKD